MPRTTNLADLREQLLVMLRERGDDVNITKRNRDTAVLLIEARSHFQRADGGPDWLGRTHAYRQWIGALYADAGYDRAAAQSLQAAIRYQSGRVLRERLGEAGAADLGLLPEAPRQRSTGRRRQRAQEAEERIAAQDARITELEAEVRDLRARLGQ